MLAGGPMRRCYQIGVGYCLILLLAACANTTALEPQNQPLDTSQARLHFIRQPAILSTLGSADIKIDGKLVGSLAADSYIVADRPPGPHRITVYGPMNTAGFEADIQIEPRVSYYFELGPIVQRNIDLFKLDIMRITGRPIPGRYGANSTYMFYSLDATAGAASVARLKAQKS